MTVQEIENPSNLPIEFTDSARNDESFVYYQFDFKAKQPLELMEIVVYNAKESKAFQKFIQKNNVILIDEKAGSVWLDGEGSVLLRDVLKYQRFQKEEPLTLKSIADEKIFVQYKFLQGNITIQYRFTDTETHYGKMDYFAK